MSTPATTELRADDSTTAPRPVDDAAFERWVEAFRGPLIGLCASWQSSWRAAEELAQDTFAEAWLGRGRFRGCADDRESVGAWLRGIALRLHLARRRADGRRPALSEAALGPVGLDGLSPEALSPSAGRAAGRSGGGASSDADADEERRAHLRAAFAELPGEHQTVLRMHYLERTTAREVAALLGTTERAVEGRLYQARLRLRDLVHKAANRPRSEVQR